MEILQVGEPMLRQPSRPLSADEIRNPAIRQLIEAMLETLREAPGVGLAAPQVGHALQLVVVEDRAEYHERVPAELLAQQERTPVPFYVLINPRLTMLGTDMPEFFEGCLSVAGYRALVPRARSVRLEYLNERGEAVAREVHGWHARILQHEIDHLNGTLYVDRMDPRSFVTNENYERLWRLRPIAEARAALGITSR